MSIITIIIIILITIIIKPQKYMEQRNQFLI